MCVCNVKKLDKYILFVVSFSFFSFSCISFYFINIFLLALGPCKLYVNLFLFIYECHTNQEFKQFDMRSLQRTHTNKKKIPEQRFFHPCQCNGNHSGDVSSVCNVEKPLYAFNCNRVSICLFCMGKYFFLVILFCFQKLLHLNIYLFRGFLLSFGFFSSTMCDAVRSQHKRQFFSFHSLNFIFYSIFE